MNTLLKESVQYDKEAFKHGVPVRKTSADYN